LDFVLLAAGTNASIIEIFIFVFHPLPAVVLCYFRRKHRRKSSRVPAHFSAIRWISTHHPSVYVVHIE
jgi:hypothetical protein